MIKLEKAEVFGWDAAIRGMRNPMNSWDKSDSWSFVVKDIDTGKHTDKGFHIGKNDLKLMKSLSKAGSDHAKFLRMINVTVDITAPLYWWKEFDTYKVGTVANSCSTMHKIHDKEFTLDDFSHEQLFNGVERVEDESDFMEYYENPTTCLEYTIRVLNHYREKFLECTVSKYATSSECADIKKLYWWQMIQLLPSSYNQKRTVQLNYQVLKNMYHARKNHKLDCWRVFCDWMLTLPCFKEICIAAEIRMAKNFIDRGVLYYARPAEKGGAE